MDDKKKKYVVPKAEKIDFADDDIITLSGRDANGIDWLYDPDGEPFSAL